MCRAGGPRGVQPEDGDGETWTSPDGRTTLAASGSINPNGITAASAVSTCVSTTQAAGGTLSLKTSADPDFTCSGTNKDGSIFYENGVAHPGKIVSVSWAYPASEKTADDPLVTEAAATLRVPTSPPNG